MSIAAIIVNYGTGDLVLDHLADVRAELASVPGSHLWIVDNASPNGDAGRLEAATARFDDVTVIAAPRNGGFSYGNNRALEEALPLGFEHVYLLNPDAYPREGCLRRLREFLKATPRAGFAGSRLEGEDGAVQCSAFRFMSAAGEFEAAARTGPISRLLSRAIVAPPPRDAPHRTDWLAGASVLIKRAVFDEIGLMDETYFLYYEEVDFQRTALKAGYEAWYVPDARTVHLVGQATGLVQGRHSSGRVPDYWYDSRRYYLRKNHGAAYMALADAARAAGTAVSGLRSIVAGRSLGDARADLRSILDARRRAGS